jgi:hypothetical protein
MPVYSLFGFFEPDPFPAYDPQISRVLYEVNNSLLQARLIPRGGIRDAIVEFDVDNILALRGINSALLNGMLHIEG